MSDIPATTFPAPYGHVVLPSTDTTHPPKNSTAMSTFSYGTSIETAIFREDNGRRFQASNDDYALPADEEEKKRLDFQHRGWKAVNHGKNYHAPMNQVLTNQGEGKRLIDLGTGTGIWAKEMAIEFPKAQVIGLDLVAYEEDPTTKLPSNLELVLGDCTRGINYPDGHFDIVHTRMLLGGVRDWASLINESVRVCKPGGMLVFAESDCDWPLVDPVPEGVGQGYLTYFQHLVKAATLRGLAINAGSRTIPEVMQRHPSITDVHHDYINMPLHPWHQDPMMRAAGSIMLEDAKMLPESGEMLTDQAFRLLIIDACGISQEEYEVLKENFLDDLTDKRVHSALPMWHNWGWRV